MGYAMTDMVIGKGHELSTVGYRRIAMMKDHFLRIVAHGRYGFILTTWG